jgi:hypothetical protein
MCTHHASESAQQRFEQIGFLVLSNEAPRLLRPMRAACTLNAAVRVGLITLVTRTVFVHSAPDHAPSSRHVQWPPTTPLDVHVALDIHLANNR